MQQDPSDRKVANILGPPDRGYIDIADEALIKKDEERRSKPRTSNPLRPSAAGFCARKLAHEFAEYRGLEPHTAEVQSPDLQRIFDLGHGIEYNMIRMWGQVELFQIKYKQQAMTFHKISEKEIIEGSNDLCVYIPGHRVIGDWKSKGDKFSSFRESKWSEIDEDLAKMESVHVINDRVYWVEDLQAFLKELKDPFFKQNFVQLNLYATSDFMTERGIDHACIWQYDKNKSRLREIRFKPSLEVRDYVINKFKSIVEAVDVNKDPELVPKEYGLGTMTCAFCIYNKRCWPDANAKKEFFSNWPDKEWPRDTERMGDVGVALEELKSLYDQAERVAANREEIEQEVCTVLEREKVRKVRFADGSIYELKFLKSPRPHFELRRAKL